MTQWVRRGLLTGIRTTGFPARPDGAPGVSPGLPLPGALGAEAARAMAARCPTGAITAVPPGVEIDAGRCVHCYRCADDPDRLSWSAGYEWGASPRHEPPLTPLGAAFRRSVHILVVDAGDCGACLHEVKQLNSPYYNMHRLGFFLTPTPRHADVLLVVGPVTDHMREPLFKAFEAMPAPKRVLAVGACALSGGVFGPSFVTHAGVSEVLPVDVEVPGQPPPPLAILDGLLLVTGRRAR